MYTRIGWIKLAHCSQTITWSMQKEKCFDTFQFVLIILNRYSGGCREKYRKLASLSFKLHIEFRVWLGFQMIVSQISNSIGMTCSKYILLMNKTLLKYEKSSIKIDPRVLVWTFPRFNLCWFRVEIKMWQWVCSLCQYWRQFLYRARSVDTIAFFLYWWQTGKDANHLGFEPSFESYNFGYGFEIQIRILS